jgi:hypothetical protein
MRKLFFAAFSIAALFLIMFIQLSCTSKGENKTLTKDEMIARGKYLVSFGGCNDCHTPKVYTDMGPMPDTTRLLSGFAAGESLPPADLSMITPGKWILMDQNITAFVGPWGISYAANLTPDNATGMGAMSEDMFIKTLREGKWMGVGRPLLPPMPWQPIGATLKNDDLKCIYAYLQSLKPIHNEVPQPVPPDKVGEVLAKK